MDNDLPAEAAPPEPVPAPEFSPAGFWVRAGALLIDTAILSLSALLPAAALGILTNFAYKTIFISSGGQTPGKMAAGIKVVTAAGEPVSVGRALGRAAGEYISAFTIGLGYLPAAFGAKRALHDYIAGTRVIYIEGVTNARKIAFSILGVAGVALIIVGVVLMVATGTGSAGKFKTLSVKSGEGATKGNLGSLRSALAIYYGDLEGQYPAMLDALVPKHLPEIPKTKTEKHPETASWTAYGAEVCTGSEEYGKEIDATKLEDTGGWGYVTDPKAKCWGMVFVDCMHPDTKGKLWPAY